MWGVKSKPLGLEARVREPSQLALQATKHNEKNNETNEQAVPTKLAKPDKCPELCASLARCNFFQSAVRGLARKEEPWAAMPLSSEDILTENAHKKFE